MMREIKFRAWDKQRKIMVGTDYPDNWEEDEDEYWDDWVGLEIGLIEKINKNERFDVMQYTGRKDVHGTEIYEGDLVQIKELNSYFEYRAQLENLIAPVVWEPDACCFQLNADDLGWGRLSLELAELLVIGNIYENPEL